MNSRINSLFMSILFLCVNSQNSVLKVFETERNMFYRHKSSNMYSTRSVLMAFTFAEVPFILGTSIVFSVIFYFIMGFAAEADRFFLFFLFVTLGFATFTMLGHMLVSLFRDSQTAQGFGALIVGLTSLFSGILIRPNNIPNFWIFL
jgi:ABC-type multidrug transport system permease subunit